MKIKQCAKPFALELYSASLIVHVIHNHYGRKAVKISYTVSRYQKDKELKITW